MPHVSFVVFSGLRVGDKRLREIGMTLPGLAERAEALAELPGLGLLTLAGMLPESWSCSYHHRTDDVDSLVSDVLADRPDLVAVSALTASINDAYRFSSLVKNEGVAVVLGGLHVTACPEEASSHCTAVVVGEGEAAWPQVLVDAEQNQLQRVYRASRLRRRVEWPAPRLDLLGAKPPRFTLQTQRGCPLACEFCGASRLLSPYREKPLESIARELEAICSTTASPLVELADDNTFVARKSLDDFFDVFANSGIRYFTEADWRIGTRPDILSRLADSGCVQVLIGIESLIFRYPGMGQKLAELERVVAAVERVQNAGVAVNGCFILGADGETEESIGRLVQFLLKSPFADVQLTLQTPFPGTELYDRLQRSQRIRPERDWSHYTLFDVTYVPDTLTVEALEVAFQRALVEVYSPAATARRREIRKNVWKRNPRFNSGRQI